MQESLAISLRAETLTRAVTSLLGLTHSLKMMWILGDDAYSRRIRTAKGADVVEDIERIKAAVEQEVRRLKGGT